MRREHANPKVVSSVCVRLASGRRRGPKTFRATLCVRSASGRYQGPKTRRATFCVRCASGCRHGPKTDRATFCIRTTSGHRRGPKTLRVTFCVRRFQPLSRPRPLELLSAPARPVVDQTEVRSTTFRLRGAQSPQNPKVRRRLYASAVVVFRPDPRAGSAATSKPEGFVATTSHVPARLEPPDTRRSRAVAARTNALNHHPVPEGPA